MKRLLFVLLFYGSLCAQNSRSDGVVFSRNGFPAPAASIAVCSPVAITAASEVVGTVTITSTLNPAQGSTVQIVGMTPTAYNGSYTVLTTSSTNFTYTNPTQGLGAGTVFGTALVTSTTPCSPLAPLCASFTDTTCTSSNPATADGLGNYSFYVKPGRYTTQFYGSGLTTRLQPDQVLSCDPTNCTMTQVNGDLWLGTAPGQYASMTACYAAASAGQTCNVPNGWNDPTWTANLVLSKNNVGFLFHGSATIPASTFQVTKASGISGAFFRAVIGSASSGVTFSYTGNTNFFSIGDTAGDTKGFVMEGFAIDTSGGGTSAQAIHLTRVQQCRLDNIKLLGSGLANSQIGINLDGTSNFTGDCVIINPFIGSYGSAIQFNGSGVNSGNANVVVGGGIFSSGKAIDIESGFGNQFVGVDVENNTTGIFLAASANVKGNTGTIWNGGNTTDFSAGAASLQNSFEFLVNSPVVSDSGTNNSVVWRGAPYKLDSSGNMTLGGFLAVNTVKPRTGANIVIQGSGAGGVILGSGQNFAVFDGSGLVTTYGSVATAGQGLPPIYGATSQKNETSAADANVLTVTPPAAVGTYRACVTISVSAATAGVISWTLKWTDSNGNAQTDIAQNLVQTTPAGTPAPAQSFTTSAAGNYSGCSTIDVNNAAAAIVIKWVGGGTTTAKMSATIERTQ